MILYSVSNIQTETANWARESCLKNIIKNHNGYKFQVLMGRNYCAIRSKKEKKNTKAEETNLRNICFEKKKIVCN